MTIKNPQLLYLDQLVRQKLIEPQVYFNRLELAYRADPTSFTEEEVDYIEKQFKKVDLKFNRDIAAGEANVMSTVNQFTSGLVEGFTTLGWSEEPDTTVESIANKLGHLIGFAPDVVASFFSMGQYVPIAAAKRAAFVGRAATQAGLQKAGAAAPGFLRKEIAPKTFTLQSIPMKVSDYVVEQSKNFLGDSSLAASGYFSRGLLANPKLRNIGEQGIHLGVALGVSAWKDGPKGMIDSAMHGVAAGALFGTIGNYVNVGKLYQNPRTRKFGEAKIRDIAAEVTKNASKEEAMNMIVRGTLGSVAQGGMSTMQGLPVPEQVYEYMLGAFFGATTKSAGFANRTKFIMKNDIKNYDLSMSEKEAITVARKDPEFQSLNKSDQQYVERHIAKIVNEKYNRHRIIMGDLQRVPQIAKALETLGYDPNKITKKEFQEVFKQVKKDEAVQDLEATESVEIKQPEVTKTGIPVAAMKSEVRPEKNQTLKEEVLNDKIDVSFSEMQKIVDNRDMNEPKVGIKNLDLQKIADDIRGVKIGRNIDEINIKIAQLARDNDYKLNNVKRAIVAEYKLPTNFFATTNIRHNRLGSYLKLKKYFDKRPDYEIDLTTPTLGFKKIPEKSMDNNKPVGGDRPETKYNKTFPTSDVTGTIKARLVIREAYTEGKPLRIGTKDNLKPITTYQRTKPLHYKESYDNQGRLLSISDQISNSQFVNLKKSLSEQGLYIYGGMKDSGNIILHRYAISRDPGKKNYISQDRINYMFTQLAKEGLVFKNKGRETVNNIYYALLESGLINPAEGVTASKMIVGMREYIKDPLYANVIKFNKYQNLGHGADIPLENLDYAKATAKSEGKFNLAMVSDRLSKFLGADGKPSISGRDAVVYSRQDVYDITQTKNFRPSGNGFLKLVGFKGPETGPNPVGNILLKTGTFRATDAMNKLMIEKNLHFIVSESAAKTQLGLVKHDLIYGSLGEKKWEFAQSDIKPFKMRPDEMYLNMGVFEKELSPDVDRAPLNKQMFDKIDRAFLGEDAQEFTDAVKTLSAISLRGNVEVTKTFNDAFEKGVLPKKDFNIADVSIDSIERAINTDIQNPVAIQAIRKILERGNQEYRETIYEASDTFSREMMDIQLYEIPDVLAKLDYNPGILMQPPVMSFVNRALLHYRTARTIKPELKYSKNVKLAPRDEEIDFEFGNRLNDETFLLGRNMKKSFKVKLPESLGGEQTLEQAFNKYENRNSYSKSEQIALEEAMEFTIIRSPNSSNGGVRVLRFAGFVDRQGSGIVTTSKNDYHKGGADKDADSVTIHQNMPNVIRRVFKKYKNELININTGETIGFETPRPIFREFVQEAKKSKDKAKQKLDDIAESFDSDARIETSKMATRGKQQMGIIVDTMTRFQNFADLINVSGGSIVSTTRSLNPETKQIIESPEGVIISMRDRYPGQSGVKTRQQMIKELQLDHLNIVEMMATSADFKSIKFYDAILNKVFETYFKIELVNPSDKYAGGFTAQSMNKNFLGIANKHIEKFHLIEQVHRELYKVNEKTIKNKEFYEKLAQDYRDAFPQGIPFYNNVIRGVEEAPNMYIQPLNFYFNAAGKSKWQKGNMSQHEVMSKLILRYQELITQDKRFAPLFKRFGLKDFWTSGAEGKANLEKLLKNDDIYMVHQRLMDYMGLYVSIKSSKQFIQDITKSNKDIGSETAEKIVMDIMDATYNIKTFNFEERQLKGLGDISAERRVEAQDINNIILSLKEKYAKKYDKETFVRIEELMEFWLQTRELQPSRTNIQKQQEKDFERQDTFLRKQVERFTRTGQGATNMYKSMSEKAKAYKKLKPTLDFAYRSVAISTEGRKKFFTLQHKHLQDVMDRMSEQIQLPEAVVETREAFYKDKNTDPPIDLNKPAEEVTKPKQKAPEEKPDTRKTIEQVTETQAIVQKEMPQFDWLKKKFDKNDTQSVQEQEQLQIFADILRKNPAAIARLEEFWIGFTFQREGVGKRLSTLTVEDLTILNKALDEKFSAKTIIDKTTGKFLGKPTWIDQMLNYKVIGKKLEGFNQEEYMKVAVPVIDKYNQQKPTTMNVIMPTSTLEYGRQTIDKADTLQKLMNPSIEKQHNGKFSFLDSNDANLSKHRKLLEEHAVNIIEYSGGLYPTGAKLSEKKRIKEAYDDSLATIKKLDGVKFPFKQGEKGKSTMISAQEFAEQIAKVAKEDYISIKKGYIQSNYEAIGKYMKSLKVPLGGYKRTTNIVDKDHPEYGTQQLEKIFLRKSGIIDEKLVHLAFKKFDSLDRPDRKVFNELFSINDLNFIMYHMHNKDRLAFRFKNIDLDKPITNSALRKQIMKATSNFIGSEQYAKTIVGDVQRGYWHRMGHFDIEANIPKIKEFQEKRIQDDIKLLKEPGGLESNTIPLEIRMALKYGEMTPTEAILAYKEIQQAKFDRQIEFTATDGATASERMVIDMLTRPSNRGFIGEYTAGMFKARSEEFLPFYRKDMDVLKRYKQKLVKAHLTNLAGLRTELLLRRFEKVNKKEEFADNWAKYMRDAFTNMMGMSNYKALNIHGIEAKDKKLYQRYIKNNFKLDGMRLNVADREKVIDFSAAIRVTGYEKKAILIRNNNDVSKAKAEVASLQRSRANELVTNVNTTGKYNSLYHFTSDEKAVKFFDGINKMFGGKLFGKLPTNESEKRHATLQRIRGLSDLEGKFELLSLLSHPKTALTNLYGGTMNTISDTGWSSFRKANSTEYVLKMLEGAEYKFINEKTGEVEQRRFETRKDIDNWLESLGVYDQMFLDMVSMDRNFGRKGFREFAAEYTRRMNRDYRRGEIETKEMHERRSKANAMEVIRDLKLEIPITEVGALPMKWSERKLRGAAFLANYINMKENVLGDIAGQVAYDSPVLINYALKGIEASQFMYQATFRPNFANTSLGRVLTRFQPYAWNSIGRRMRLFKEARQVEWNREVLASKKFQRQFTFDLMALAMANIFVASIFEYALSPPMNWLQDTTALLFGDKKERERAFFSSYPHPVLAPLQVVTPPIGRFVLSPITAILNGDFEQFRDYTAYSYLPYGRLLRDGLRTYNSPAMAVDFMTGLPLRQIHTIRREQVDSQKEPELEVADYSTFED